MSKLKVLIAEDDKICQEIYKKALPGDTFDKRFVNNGLEALVIHKSWNPDILLLDILMPVKSGYETLKEIRELEENFDKKTVIIMATSMTAKEDILDCLKIGIQGYIMKPFKTAEINTKILDYYQKYQTSQK